MGSSSFLRPFFLRATYSGSETCRGLESRICFIYLDTHFKTLEGIEKFMTEEAVGIVVKILSIRLRTHGGFLFVTKIIMTKVIV